MTYLILFALWNVVACVIVFIDKRRARQGQWRIRERTLFLWALLFGAMGILVGMYMFRHKTRHLSFVIGIPCLLMLNLIGYYLLLVK